MKRGIAAITVFLMFLCSPAFGRKEQKKKDCEELKAEITAKLEKKGVKNYTLTIVSPDEVKGRKVVGSCDGGTKRIVYVRR